MNQLDPQKRAILAGEYVLGILPPAARARYERAMRYDPVLARLADQWVRRFAAIDERTAPVTPPARVWRAIEARTVQRALRRDTLPRVWAWRDSLAFWRATAVGALAVAAALVIVIATGVMGPAAPKVMAVLTNKEGQPAWVVSQDRRGKTLAIEAMATQTIDPDHAFELWCLAGGKPWALGVISPERHKRVTIPAWEVPGHGAAFAVSLEPAGGSPSGAPTGPVLYQGGIIND